VQNLTSDRSAMNDDRLSASLHCLCRGIDQSIVSTDIIEEILSEIMQRTGERIGRYRGKTVLFNFAGTETIIDLKEMAEMEGKGQLFQRVNPSDESSMATLSFQSQRYPLDAETRILTKP
jgi:hypothetical protein